MSTHPYRPNVAALVVLVVLTAATRLLPHPPNFVPVGAMAIFGAAALPKQWLAFLLPLAAYYLSDLVLNNLFYGEYFDGFYWGADPYVYGGVVLMIGVGTVVLRGSDLGWGRIAGAATGASLVFFLLSNLGVWAGGLLYPQTAAGLLTCYAAGLPFLASSLAANLIFSGVLFGAAKRLELVETPRLVTAKM